MKIFNEIRLNFIPFLAIGAVLFFVSSLILSSKYDPATSVFHAESQRNSHRQIVGLQDMAVNKDLQSCIYGTNLSGLRTPPIYISIAKISHLTRYPTKEEINSAIDDTEALCSDQLIQRLSVANPQAGGAVIYLLKEQNFKMDPKYLKYGKQDTVALASVNF